MSGIEKLIKRNGRVCPQPKEWDTLWRILCAKPRNSEWKPPAPLILAAWHETTDAQKRARLAEHIGWARDLHRFDEVQRFLESLAEEQWHHAECAD